MRKFCKYYASFLSLICILSASMYVHGQVGINTTSPQGILDVNSSSTGIVLPRLALTATNVMAPAVNPKPGVTNIPVGTTVFNTNVTATGSNDVTVGIYSWDGSRWIPQFNQIQCELFESDVYFLRSRSNSTLTISGINGQSFTADYTGTYRIRISVNYGGGGAKVPDQGGGGSQSDGQLNIARQSGTFNLTIGGESFSLPVHSYSTSYDPEVSATNYFAIWQQYETTIYRDFTENEVVSLAMTFTQDPAIEFVSNGNSGSGRGYVAYDLPCTIEFTYVSEED